MEVINNLKIDLLKPGVKPMVNAMQADENSRVLEIALSANGSEWEIPDGVSFSMAYKKPDGTKGLYDTLPDGSSASSVDGNVVSIRLAPQMLTVPGIVTASVVISAGDQRISTFPIIVNVIQNPAVGAVGSEDYYYSVVIGNLDDLKTENKSSLVAAINEIFSAGGSGSYQNAVLYTPQKPTEEQKEQARENIGAMAAATGEYVAQNVEVLPGYYDSAVRYENANYKCAMVSCAPGEKYRVSTVHQTANKWPVAWIYDKNKNLLGTAEMEPVTTNAKYFDNCEFTTPDGCDFFCVNCWNMDKFSIVVEKYEIEEFATLKYVNSNLTTRETAFRELRTEIKTGYYDCTQSGITLVNHENYRCTKVDCVEGEKYKITKYAYFATKWPVAWLYSVSGKLMGTVGDALGQGEGYGDHVNDFELRIPAGCAYFVVNHFAYPDAQFVIKRYIPGAKPLSGKNAIYLGDSITYIGNGWRPEFNALTGVNEVLCTAVSGAHLCDYEDTVVDGVDYTTGSKNTVSNQVQSIINNPPSEHIDLIIIAAGTNDHAQSAEFEGGVTQFVDENNAYIDVDNIERTRYDGAMRWIAEKLWDMFPDAVIFFATPIQGAETSRGTWIQILKSDYMQEIAAYLGTPVIDATRKSGIYGRYENTNAAGKYLSDGLHPNMAGRIKLGRCYAAEVINYFSYLQD